MVDRHPPTAPRLADVGEAGSSVNQAALAMGDIEVRHDSPILRGKLAHRSTDQLLPAGEAPPERRHEAGAGTSRRGKSAMSNGPDLIGAYGACQAARRDIREMQAEEDSAKAHFQQAEKQSQNVDKAETVGDIMQHTLEATEEQTKGELASQRADQHRKDAFEHLGEYNAKMGRDPRKGTPALGSDGPDCKPVGDAMAKRVKVAAKGVTDAVRGLVKEMGRFVP
jgi:hypothetical protein